MLFEKARKMPNMSFSRSKMNENVFFLLQTTFQNLTCRKNFFSKSNALCFPSQIVVTFVVKKRFQLLICKTQNIQERCQQRLPTGPKSYSGRGRFEQVLRLRNQLVNAAKQLC